MAILLQESNQKMTILSTCFSGHNLMKGRPLKCAKFWFKEVSQWGPCLYQIERVQDFFY